MWTQRFKTGLLLTTTAACVLAVTACGPAQQQSSNNTASSSSASGSMSASPSTPAPGSASPSTNTSPATEGLCKAAALKGSLDASGGGAAGSVYMKLLLTNTGATPCVLEGFAGVSLTTDATGEPIGAPAERDDTQPVVKVQLAPGQTGVATLRYTQAGNYPDCTAADAAGYRIYPPNDTASLFIAQPQRACSNAVIKLLSVTAFQAS